MKKLTQALLTISLIFALTSCSVSEKDWHERVRIMGAKSVYIDKNGKKTTGEEWYKNHPNEDKKFKEKYGDKKTSPQVFIATE